MLVCNACSCAIISGAEGPKWERRPSVTWCTLPSFLPSGDGCWMLCPFPVPAPPPPPAVCYISLGCRHAEWLDPLELGPIWKRKRWTPVELLDEWMYAWMNNCSHPSTFSISSWLVSITASSLDRVLLSWSRVVRVRRAAAGEIDGEDGNKEGRDNGSCMNFFI